jgi:hypothetical protein
MDFSTYNLFDGITDQHSVLSVDCQVVIHESFNLRTVEQVVPSVVIQFISPRARVYLHRSA